MPLGRKPCKYLHWPQKFLQQAPAEHSRQRGIWEVDFFDSCQLCSTTWLWIWNPSSVCPRQAVRSQHFPSTKTWMCVSWDSARCLSSWNTAQETMIIAQPPVSPVDALLSSYPGAPPSGAHSPLLLRAYRLLHLKTDSSPWDSVLVFLRFHSIQPLRVFP